MSDTLTRVNAWLASRAEWLDASEQRQQLRAQWHAVTLAFGAESAAASGVLLGLVREAWGCDAWRRLTIEPAGAGWCIVLRNGRHRPPGRAHAGWELDRIAHPRYLGESGPLGANEFATEADALLAALEAAP